MKPHRFLLALVLLLSSFLLLFALDREQFGLPYYAAGVLSMTDNLRAFFFNAFDAPGFVTLDKSPLAFWVQAVFVKAFGFHSLSLLLPQALSGLLCVVVLYRMVAKRFGPGAGLWAAWVLALTPIFVATSRNNTPDVLLLLLVLLAAGEALRACEEGDPKCLVVASVWAGLAFHAKMLQSSMVWPALACVVLLTPGFRAARKMRWLAGAVALTLALSLLWVLAVDAVPADKRPRVGGTTSNRAMELVTGYNGLRRISLAGYSRVQDKLASKTSLPEGTLMPKAGRNPWSIPKYLADKADGPDPLRLFKRPLAGQSSWFLAAALGTAFWGWWFFWRRRWIETMPYLSIVLWTAWLLPVTAYFSFTEGFFQTYYLVMLGPPVAALTGIGVDAAIRAFPTPSWKRWILPAGVLLTAAFQFLIEAWSVPGREPLSAVWVFACAVPVFFASRIPKRWVPLSVLPLFIAPAVWSFSPIRYGGNPDSPLAGPALAGNYVTAESHAEDRKRLEKVSQYLLERTGETTYLCATPTALEYGADLILVARRSVLPLGGFNGWDPVLSPDKLAEMVRDKKVRFLFMRKRGWGKKAHPVPDSLDDVLIRVLRGARKVDPPGGGDWGPVGAELFELAASR